MNDQEGTPDNSTSSSDSQDSVKDQFRRQQRWSDQDGEEEEEEEESEDEWSTFLSSSAKKQRGQSRSSSSSVRSSTPDTNFTQTPTEYPLVAPSRPFQLNPIRARLARKMVDDEMDGSGVKVEDDVQEGIQDAGEKSTAEMPQTFHSTMPPMDEPAGEEPATEEPAKEEPVMDATKEELESTLNQGEDHQAADDRGEQSRVDNKDVDQAGPTITEAINTDADDRATPEPINDLNRPTSDGVPQQENRPSEIFEQTEGDMQPETNIEMEADSTSAPEPQVAPTQPDPAELSLAQNAEMTEEDRPETESALLPPTHDALMTGDDEDMDTADAQPEQVVNLASTPAAASVAGVEEGEEELDEEVAPTPEPEVDAGTTDVEMDGSSVPPGTMPMPVTEVKIRKKPGPKPKPKQVGQKIEAAAKKAAKGTKGKKVDELKTTSKKTARFTPVSSFVPYKKPKADGRNPLTRALLLSFLIKPRRILNQSAIGRTVFAERKNRTMMKMSLWSGVNRKLSRS